MCVQVCARFRRIYLINIAECKIEDYSELDLKVHFALHIKHILSRL
jgi:hypothetical protein